MSYAVVIHHNFAEDTRVIPFDEYDKAKAYLHWVWEAYYNEEIDNDSYLNEAECWHEDEIAKVTWTDGCWTYFELIDISSDKPEPGFLKLENWKAYL